MANTFSVLYRGAAPTSNTTLFTATSTTMVTSILVANTSSSNQTYTLSLDGVSIATTVPINANDTKLLEIKQVLVNTDTVSGFASAASVTFHISGLVIT